MPSLTIRDIPEKILAQLRADAKRERRSLNNEILCRLETSLETAIDLEQARAQRRAVLAAHWERIRHDVPLDLTPARIEEIIDEGRDRRDAVSSGLIRARDTETMS